MADLYLGAEIEGDNTALLDGDHLTTHAVCLGMTGSGKTGLGIVALEELAKTKVPLLVIDLKGDMVNLLLGFPSLLPEEFEPWLPSDSVQGRDRMTVAREQAEFWAQGLQKSGLGSEDIRAVREGLSWQLVTPGVAGGAPLDILPTLSAPEGWNPDLDPDAATDRVNGVASALLSLIGRGGDPLTDRDHVLLASIVLEHWRRGDQLDLGALLRSLTDPPISTLGAFSLESFFPREDRLELVMELNTLLASPAFGAWTRGIPLQMESLLGTVNDPRGTVVSLAHLDEKQRLFVLALLVSELVAWMRRQPASAGLRALLYIDEVQGILPPHPKNPPTKGPLMTLLKQGRAFGVGAWLATQNPVDLDYKALGNAGVKVIGRLITDRDRERALEGLGMTTLEDGRDPDNLVASLGKRQFLLLDVRAKKRIRLFSSRWAMSYLRGPVTLAEMKPLFNASGSASAPQAKVPTGGGAAATRPPVIAADVPVLFSSQGAGHAAPSILVRSRVVVERRTMDLFKELEETWRVPVGSDGIDWEAAELWQASGEILQEPPAGMTFPNSIPADLDRELPKAGAAFVSWRARRPVEVLAHAKLKLVAEEGEDREAFLERCYEAADRADDTTQERVRKRFEKKMETLKRRMERESDELERDQEQLSSRKAEEKLNVVEGLFSVLLGSRGLKSAARKASSKARGAATKRRMRQRAEASVVESEREIERLEDELEDLAEDLQDEIDRIADESEQKAEQIEEVKVRPMKKDVVVREIQLLWE